MKSMTSSRSSSETYAPWMRMGLPLPRGEYSMSPIPMSFSAPAASSIIRDSIALETAKAIRLGILAFMRPVMTSADGLCVAIMRCIPEARPI